MYIYIYYEKYLCIIIIMFNIYIYYMYNSIYWI